MMRVLIVAAMVFFTYALVNILRSSLSRTEKIISSMVFVGIQFYYVVHLVENV